jgi:hypothetical protein
MNIRSIFLFFVSSIHFYKYFFNKNLLNIINNFNYKTLYISKQYEYICLDLMKELYNKDLLVLDTTYISKKQIVNKQIKIIDTIKNDDILWPSIVNIIVSGTKTILFTDLISMYETFFITGELIVTYTFNKVLYNYNNDKIDYEIPLKLSNTYRQINNDIYTLSNIYCTHTFHIHIDMIDNNYLVIIGDSIDYYWIIYFLQTIETNIKLIIENNLKINNKYDRDLLVSLYERIFTLKNVVQELQVIIYYSFNRLNNDLFKYSNLSKNSLESNEEAIVFIKDYLHKIIYKLNIMLHELYKFFPIQENEKKQILNLIKEKNILNNLDYNITQLENYYKKDSWNKYFFDIQIVFIDFCIQYSKMIGTIIQGILYISISPLTGVIKSFGNILNEIINILMFSKNGLMIIGFIILICNLANIVNLIIYIITKFFRKFIFE